MVRRVFFSQAPERSTRRRRDLLRLPRQWRVGAGLCLSARGWQSLSLRLPGYRKNANAALMDRRATPPSAHPPWPLCGIQSPLRPRDYLRSKDRRKCRGNPDVAAPYGRLALRREFSLVLGDRSGSNLLNSREQPIAAATADESPYFLGLGGTARVAADEVIGIAGRTSEADDIVDSAPPHICGGVLQTPLLPALG